MRSAAVVLALAAAPLAVAKAPAESFCTPQEVVIFACRTGAKLVSICASKDASPTKGHVEYRFGKPDRGAPLELRLPESPTLPPQAATGSNVPFAGGGGTWMRFRKGEYAYVAYSGIGRWGPKGETATQAGIVVERGGKAIATLRCKGGDAAGEMGPDWFGKAGIRAGPDEDFDFPLAAPSLGGTTPDFVFTKLLGLPSIVVPLAPYDENNHAPNESTKVSLYLAGVRSGMRLTEAMAARA